MEPSENPFSLEQMPLEVIYKIGTYLISRKEIPHCYKDLSSLLCCHKKWASSTLTETFINFIALNNYWQGHWQGQKHTPLSRAVAATVLDKPKYLKSYIESCPIVKAKIDSFIWDACEVPEYGYCMRTLIQAGIDVWKIQNRALNPFILGIVWQEDSPLYVATCNGNLLAAKYLLQYHNTTALEFLSSSDPLYEATVAAIQCGNHALLSLFLESGANANWKHHINDPSFLSKAIYRRDIISISILLKHGAHIDDTTLALAQQNGVLELLKKSPQYKKRNVFSRLIHKIKKS
jgi:hypothetical protein